MMLMIIMMSTFLTLMLIFLNTSIASKKLKERETPSAFECGFDPSTKARMPFSLRFFLIAVIFLIFDVEITFIFPIPISMGVSDIKGLTGLTLLFLFILILGLYHEWNEGALNWK